MSFRAYTRATAASEWTERDLLMDTVSISDTINERSTASLALLDRTGTLSFHRGEGVKLTLNNNTAFIGFIDKSNERRLGKSGHRTHDLELVDLHYLTDKRIVANAYQNETAGAIVRSFITEELAGEGVTAGIIEDGPTIRAQTFNYIPVADAIQRLATRSGFWWRVTPAGALDFASPITLLAVFAGSTTLLSGDESLLAGASADDTSTAPAVDLADVALADTINLTRRNTGYRNRQWIKGGRAETVAQVEIQTGDGEKRAFAVGFPLAKEPTIEVDRGGGFLPEVVGVAGLQEGTEFLWRWSFGSPVVSQYVAQPVLGATDRVRITYTGLFDVIAKVDDTPEQDNRSLVEGGTGIVESVLIDRTSTSQDDAFQLGGELVDYWKRQATAVRFAARYAPDVVDAALLVDSTTTTADSSVVTADATGASADFTPGRTLNVTSGEHDLAGVAMLVQSVELFSRSGDPTAIVTLVGGPISGSWAQWFGSISRRLDAMDESRGGEAEVITTLESFSKLWTEAERPNIFYEAYPAADLYPGATLVPAFEHDQRVLFLSWYFGGVELGRKAFTTQSGAETSEIATTVVLVTAEAVGNITELGWWGGQTATAALGSGVEVDRQAFVTTKTNIEQLQVVKTDTRWA